MHSVEAALEIMLAAIKPLAGTEVALDEALGRTLATPLRARRDQPPFAASAMDGYALRSADPPAALRIIGESAAGHGFDGVLSSGEAVRISTGAPVPAGADTVLIQEDARIENDALIAPSMSRGKNIRAQSCDFSSGDILLAPGAVMSPGAVALAASAGFARLPVISAPRIAILSGGDEIAAPGAAIRADQVFDSASYGVAALAQTWGAQAKRQSPLPDDEDAIVRAARAAFEMCDLLVLIGGASVGPHDHARAAMQSLELEVLIEKVSVKPGKPTWFGITPYGPVLGLPGNPASALVCARLFLAAMLEKFLARAHPRSQRSVQARLLAALPANGARESYLRGILETDENGSCRVRALHDQDSSLVTVLSQSNVLIRREANAPPASAEALVSCLFWLPMDAP